MKASTKAHLEHEAEGGVAGALTGALVGSVAGPPGAIAGAVIGAVAGAVTGLVMDEEAESTAVEDKKLDGEIGISGGDMGARRPDAPAAKIGAFSEASMGASPPSEEESAEGPMQQPS